jgi:drug/metabolite transporter (DMT)-like permease
MLAFIENQYHYRMRQYQKQHQVIAAVDDASSTKTTTPSITLIFLLASFYVLSGVTQPLIMTLSKEVGIADPRAQLYMLAYYIGPASVACFVTQWPSLPTIGRTALIAAFDISAQAMNYTGATLAGPTIFAIIYSSVTVWTAVFSLLVLRRPLSAWQWLGVVTVFGGLCITGLNSHKLGPQVLHGSTLIFLGSIMHALTYVMSEKIMAGREGITIYANCAIQGMVAFFSILLWQLLYTRTHWKEVIEEPMLEATGSTSWWPAAIGVLAAFAIANFVHALCFFHTLKHFPGGATSAGVMKALQAVLVFVVTSVTYCGRLGGPEMCFSNAKLVSLIVVVGGVLLFGKATEVTQKQHEQPNTSGGSGYEEILNEEVVIHV